MSQVKSSRLEMHVKLVTLSQCNSIEIDVNCHQFAEAVVNYLTKSETLSNNAASLASELIEFKLDEFVPTDHNITPYAEFVEGNVFHCSILYADASLALCKVSSSAYPKFRCLLSIKQTELTHRFISSPSVWESVFLIKVLDLL